MENNIINHIKRYILNYTNYLIVAFLLLAIICISILRIAYYIDIQTYYLEAASDSSYYYAIGKSIAEEGTLQNITYEPPVSVVNAHIGIAFAYAGFYSLFDEPVAVYKHSGWFGVALLVLSLFGFIKSGQKLKIPAYALFLLAAYLAVHPVYFGMALNGRTEAFFYPLVIFWFYAVICWWKTGFELKGGWVLTGLFAVSVLAYSFRVQALILFIALIMTLALNRYYRAAMVSFLLSAGAVVSILLLNVALAGTGMGRGETSHFANIRDVSLDRVIDFLPAVSQLIYVYERNILITGVFFLILAAVCGHLFYLTFRQRDSILILCSLSVLGTLASAFLFRSSFSTGDLRYIAYILPVLFTGYLYALQFVKYRWQRLLPSYAMMIGVLLLTVLALRHEVVDWQVRNDGPRSWHQGVVERMESLKAVDDSYPNAKWYSNNKVATGPSIRQIYSVTEKPLYSNFEISDIEDNSLLMVIDENKWKSKINKHHPEAEFQKDFRINHRYLIYYIP